MEAFNDLQIPKISLKASDGSEELTIAVFNGRLGLTIFGEKGQPPAWKQGLSSDNLYLFKKTLKLVQQAQPGTKKPFTFSRFDEATKRYVVDSSLIIGKDDKQMFYFEAQFTKNGSPKNIRFILKSPNTVTTGDDYNDVAKSANRFGTIIDHIESYVPILSILSARKFEGGGGGGGYNKGGSGGGGYNKGSGGGGGYSQRPQQAAPAAAPAGDFGSDTLFD